MSSMFGGKPTAFGTPFNFTSSVDTSANPTTKATGLSPGGFNFGGPVFGSNTSSPTGNLFSQNTCSSTSTPSFGSGQPNTFGGSQNTGFMGTWGTWGNHTSQATGLSTGGFNFGGPVFGSNTSSPSASLFSQNTCSSTSTPSFGSGQPNTFGGSQNTGYHPYGRFNSGKPFGSASSSNTTCSPSSGFNLCTPALSSNTTGSPSSGFTFCTSVSGSNTSSPTRNLFEQKTSSSTSTGLFGSGAKSPFGRNKNAGFGYGQASQEEYGKESLGVSKNTEEGLSIRKNAGDDDADELTEKMSKLEAVPKLTTEASEEKSLSKSAAFGAPREYSLQLSNKRFVTVSKYQGVTLVGIREYYDCGGELKPGKKGISLTVDQWKKLKEHVEDIDDAVQKCP